MAHAQHSIPAKFFDRRLKRIDKLHVFVNDSFWMDGANPSFIRSVTVNFINPI